MYIEYDMRECLLDGFNDEDDQEMIGELEYSELCDAVERYYETGLKGFLESL